MLKKLFKYEWKATVRYMLPFLLITLGSSLVIGILNCVKPLWEVASRIMVALNMAGTISLLSVIIFGSIVICGWRFYKNMLTDEGYLSNTLPVTINQQLIAKLTVSSIWVFISFFWCLVCLVVIYFPMVGMNVFPGTVHIGTTGLQSVSVDVSNMTMGVFLKELGKTVSIIFNTSLPVFLLELLFSFLFAAIGNMVMIYASIGLGQMFTSHRLIGALVWYMITNFVNGAVSLLALGGLFLCRWDFNELMRLSSENTVTEELFGQTVTLQVSPPHLFTHLIVLCIVITLIEIVACYFLTHWSLTKKLNLE